MLRGLIQQLRYKPKHARDNIALTAAGSITAVVLVAWLVVTPERVSVVAEEVRAQPSSFALMIDKIKEQTAAVSNSMREFGEATETIGDELMATSSAPLQVAEPDFSGSSSTVLSTSSRAIRIATTSPTSTTSGD